MNVGLPGAGIGGLFYLLCALAMPIKEVILTITKPGHKFRYRLIVRQLSIVIGIVIGVIAIYKLVSNVFGFGLSLSVRTDSLIFYSLLPVLISFSLLMVILTSVWLVSIFSSQRKAPVDN